MTDQVILTAAVVTIAVAVIVRVIFGPWPRILFRRARAWRCRRRGHPYPTRSWDGAIRGQRVRVTFCAHCETVTAGDVLTPRKVRRTATRRGVDPLGLVGLDGRPLAKGRKLHVVGEAGPETFRRLS